MMHPQLALSPEIIFDLRNQVHNAEAQGMLTESQLKIIHQEKWFHLFVPEQFGGLALSLPEAVRLEESIAYADGSVGWVVTLCAGAGMFIGYLSEDLAREIFIDAHVCLAGSGQANGAAKIIHGGFQITGSWPYASGAPHATHFTANCVIDDSRELQAFIFKKEEVSLHSSWKYIGLNATAGYSFSVNSLKVPANRTFKIDPDFAVLPDPVYRYPFLQLAETTIAANISGMCCYFFELAQAVLMDKQPANPRSELVKGKGLELIAAGLDQINLLRDKFYEALDQSWATLIADDTITSLQLEAVSNCSKSLAGQCRQLVNQLYPYCGLDAARVATPINQVWRNINTASQHTLLLDLG